MKVCKANLYIFVMLVEKPDWLLYCDSYTLKSTIFKDMVTDMAIAAVMYISVSILLAISAGIFFLKAIQFLTGKKKKSNHKNTEQSMLVSPNFDDSLVISARREEIVAMLERQFASSPSSDS
jgi:hypothetical protein